MVAAGFRVLFRSPRLRFWTAGLCAAGAPLLAVGCAQRTASVTQFNAVPRHAVVALQSTPGANLDPGVRRVSFEPEHPKMLPAPAAENSEPLAPAATPVNLDSIFRLAEEKNAQIAVAREKVHESNLEGQLAAKAWLPTMTAGVGYFRHEGGIQNEDGTLTRSSFSALYPGIDVHADFDVREATFARIDAGRKRWQQQGARDVEEAIANQPDQSPVKTTH